MDEQNIPAFLPDRKTTLKHICFGQYPNATKSIKTPLGAGLWILLMHKKEPNTAATSVFYSH